MQAAVYDGGSGYDEETAILSTPELQRSVFLEQLK